MRAWSLNPAKRISVLLSNTLLSELYDIFFSIFTIFLLSEECTENG